MERLTVKTGIGYLNKLGGTGKTYTKYDLLNDFDRCIQKLGKLEDIEQELGIPLEVLFKALKEGAYTKIDGQIWKCKSIDIYHSDYFKKYLLEAYCIENVETFDSSYEHQLNIEDYGKTWALTKEELE